MEETRDGRTWHKAERWETSDEDCDFLYGLVRAVKPHLVVETGTFKGKATSALAEALDVNGEDHSLVVTFDRGFHGEIRRIGPYEGVTVFDRQGELPGSLMQWLAELDAIVGFAFLDSNHDFATVYGELSAVHPYLEPGGYIAVHDVLYYGTDEVRDAIRRFMSEHPMEYHYVEIASYAGIGLLRKLK